MEPSRAKVVPNASIVRVAVDGQLEKYMTVDKVRKIVKIQAVWKGRQIRRVIDYLKTTQKVSKLLIETEHDEVLHARRGQRNCHDE
jgi:hypothetical protein